MLLLPHQPTPRRTSLLSLLSLPLARPKLLLLFDQGTGPFSGSILMPVHCLVLGRILAWHH